MKRTIPQFIIFCLTAAWLIAPGRGEAGMSGNCYTSLLHEVSYTRPDESWELRESPAKANAVAAFSNGEGRALALLLHIAIKPREVVSSPIDLRERWNELAQKIASAANAGEGHATLSSCDYEIVDGAINFDIHYESSVPGANASLANWIHGFILRDTEDRQHVYAVRFAAQSSVFDAWQSQFERIAASLEYQGSRASTVYTDPPIPLWWWFAGVGVVLGVIFFATRNRDHAPMHRLKHPVAIPGVSPAGIGGLPPSQLGMPPMDSGIPNVPDNFLPPSDLGAPADLSNVPDSVFYNAGANDQFPTNEQLGNTPDFWKCSCGRMNPGNAGHCMRCDALKRVS